MKLYFVGCRRAILFISLSLTLMGKPALGKAGSVFIHGMVNPDLGCDSVHFTWTRFGMDNYNMNMVEEITAAVKMGHFFVRIPNITAPVSLKMVFRNMERNVSRFPGGYYMESGDSVFIDDTQRNDQQPFKIFFSGKSALKLECQRFFMEQSANLEKAFPDTRILTLAKINSLDSLCYQQLVYLEKIKSNLSYSAYLYLRVKVLTSCEVMKCVGPVTYRIKSKFPFVNQYFQNQIQKMSTIKSFDKETCAEFYSYAFYKYKYDSAVVLNKMIGTEDYFNYFLHHYSGQVRELLLTRLLLTYKFPELNECIERSLEIIRTQKYRNSLRSLQKNINGKNGMDFRLMDTSHIFHSLKYSFKDSIVILDFWFTGCGGCLQMKPYMDTLMQRYKSLPVKFVSVSSDQDFSIWKNSVEEQRYTGMGALNLYTNGLGHRASLIKLYNVISYPTIIVLDKNRNIMPLPTDPRLDNYRSLEKIIHSLLQ